MATSRTPAWRRAMARKRKYRKRRDRGEHLAHPFPTTARKRRSGARGSTSDVPAYQDEQRAREVRRSTTSHSPAPAPSPRTPVGRPTPLHHFSGPDRDEGMPPRPVAPIPAGPLGITPHPIDLRVPTASRSQPTSPPRVLPTLVPPSIQREAAPQSTRGRSLDEVIQAALHEAPGKRLTKASLREKAERANNYSPGDYQQTLSKLREVGKIDIDNLGRRGRAQDDAIITLLAA